MAELLVDLGDAVTIADILAALGELLLWLSAVGLIALAVGLVYAILWPLRQFVHAVSFGQINSIPGEHAVEQVLTNALGDAAGGVDSAAGRFFNGLKTIIVAAAEEAFGLAVLAAYLWYWIYVKYPLHIIEQVGREALRLAHTVVHRLTHLEHKVARLETTVPSIAQGVYPRLRSLEHEVGKVLEPEVKTTRTLAREAEDTATAAYKAVQAIPYPTSITTWAGAIAVALAGLGLGGLSCPGFLNLLSKRGCGLGGFIDSLLGLLIDAVVLENICTILPWLEDAFGAIEPDVVSFLTAIPLADCELLPQGWVQLRARPGRLPPRQVLGALPA